MAFKVPTQAYTGTIRPITLEKDDTVVTVGGETAYPFYTFEGEMPHLPKIAIQVPDFTPEDWADACLEPYRDVLGNPVAWAKKAQDAYKADIIVLWLKSTDPNGLNRSAEEAAETAKQVLEAIDVPLIVWGTANVEKDTEVLRQVAMACADKRICLGPVEEANHKQIGAQALAYDHLVIGSSPIDINLAKQLNILLGNLGVSEDNMIIDPTTGALGYGIEYSYSVMERIRQAALTQQDDRLQLPMISNLAEEVWKTKEAKLPDDPLMGNAENRGVLLEAMTATTLLMAGADILVMRHPKAIQLIRNYIADMAGVERPEALEVVTEEAAPEPAKAPAPSAAPAAVGNLPPGMRLEIDVASIMDAPITVGSEYILALVKVSQEDEGGITIAQNAVEAFSAFASGEVAAPKTPEALAEPPELAPQEEEPEKEEEPKVEYLKTWDVPDDTVGDYDYPVEKVENFTGEKVDLLGQSAEEGKPEGKEDWRLKCEDRDEMITYLKTAQHAVEVTPSPAPAEKATAPAKPAEAEKKPEKEEEPKVEYLKTWDVPDDTVGDYDYPVEKVENFTGEKVDLLGQSAEEGIAEGKADWRLKLQDKDQMVQYLKTGLRYWYSTEVFGSEKRKTPA